MISEARDVVACVLTYNHANVIESTLQTILAQTVEGHEIVVSDDCSTDGTWEALCALSRSDSRVRAIRTPRNLGMAGNANFAIASTDRPYVALLHHDDLCAPDLLEKWRGVLVRHPDVGFVFNAYANHGTSRIDGHALRAERVDGPWFLEHFLLAQWGCPVRGTAMIRRTAWEASGGMREEFGLLADIDLWMRLSAATAVGYVAEPLITVRHARPDYYPEIYRGNGRFWERQRYLYEIHARNRLAYWRGPTAWLRFLGFRAKLSAETFKWLSYAVVRRRADMIETSDRCATHYDLLPLRWYRSMLRFAMGHRP
jgi:GT2 family glycosyltransferase